MSNYVVIRSSFIDTRAEALDYFAARIVGERLLTVGGVEVRIRVPHDGIHIFTTDPGELPLEPGERVERRVQGGRVDVRRFSLERARLLDEVYTAIERFTVSTGGTGRQGGENRLLHGPALPDGQHMRVVLRPEGGTRFACVSAYPVAKDVWLAARRDRRAKFPP